MSISTLFSGLAVQKRVVHALFLRELKTRFGKYRLGYFWALLEPLAQLLILVFIFGVLMNRAKPDISFLVFLVCGIVPWFVFSKITSRSIAAIESNKGLFSYRPVHPIDALLSRACLEMLIYFWVYMFLMGVLYLKGEFFTFIDFPKVMLVFASVFILSVGIGLIFMVIGHAFPEAQKWLPIVNRPLYFLSGVMFPLSLIPMEYHKWLDWNPLVHAFELLRKTVSPGYHALPSMSLAYLLVCSVCVFAFGLILYKGREPAILRS